MGAEKGLDIVRHRYMIVSLKILFWSYHMSYGMIFTASHIQSSRTHTEKRFIIPEKRSPHRLR